MLTLVRPDKQPGNYRTKEARVSTSRFLMVTGALLAVALAVGCAVPGTPTPSTPGVGPATNTPLGGAQRTPSPGGAQMTPSPGVTVVTATPAAGTTPGGGGGPGGGPVSTTMTPGATPCQTATPDD